ncbi:MAG: hypothetical protein H6Q70_1095 [Firmicutes bacterium]|jgi:hypothetical protein|nr:hypothetical protein [Bacillota bacterium]
MFVVDDKTVKMEKLENLEATQRNPELDAFMKKERSKELQIKSKKKLMAMMGGAFVVALFIGYFTMSYYHDKQDIAENERMYKKQMVVQQKETANTDLSQLGEVKNKTENYLKDVTANKEAVTQSLNNVEKEVKKVASTTENMKAAGESKLQTILIENAPIINSVTQFIQVQKNRFMQFISEQTAKSNTDKKR